MVELLPSSVSVVMAVGVAVGAVSVVDVVVVAVVVVASVVVDVVVAVGEVLGVGRVINWPSHVLMKANGATAEASGMIVRPIKLVHTCTYAWSPATASVSTRPYFRRAKLAKPELEK